MRSNENSVNELLQTAIATFVATLTACATAVRELGSSVPGRDASEFVADWAQASWEMLVEASVSPVGAVYLEPYGEGADCNEVGSRVWRAGVESTHAVHCVPRSGTGLLDALTGEKFDVPARGYSVEQFVTLTEDGWYAAETPFDCVLVSRDETDTVVHIKDVWFILERLR